MLVFTQINKYGVKTKTAVRSVFEVNQVGDGTCWVKYPDASGAGGVRNMRVADKFGHIMKKIHNADKG
jgi:hypothetical protein